MQWFRRAPKAFHRDLLFPYDGVVTTQSYSSTFLSGNMRALTAHCTATRRGARELQRQRCFREEDFSKWGFVRIRCAAVMPWWSWWHFFWVTIQTFHFECSKQSLAFVSLILILFISEEIQYLTKSHSPPGTIFYQFLTKLRFCIIVPRD